MVNKAQCEYKSVAESLIGVEFQELFIREETRQFWFGKKCKTFILSAEHTETDSLIIDVKN